MKVFAIFALEYILFDKLVCTSRINSKQLELFFHTTYFHVYVE